MPSAPLPGALGVPWAVRRETGWLYGLQTEPAHANPQGAIHGGVLVTLADHALSLLAWQAAERAPCTTVHLGTHFLAAAQPGEFVWVDGEVTRRTGGMVFLRGLLRAGLGEAAREVASAEGVWRILRPARRDGT